MNAAFLLVTTAWLAGDTAAGPHGAAPAPVGNACSADCCDNGCGGHQWGRRLHECLRRCFHRDNCCEPCPAPRCHTKCHAPRCEPQCDPCAGRKLFHFNCFSHGHSCCEKNTCAPACPPANCCDPCGHGGHGLFERLRNHFHRGNDCCDPCAGGTTVMPKSGETIITPPKKMPNPSSKEPPAKEVRFDNAPAVAPAVPAIQAEPQNPAPPAIVPGVSNDNLRSPF